MWNEPLTALSAAVLLRGNTGVSSGFLWREKERRGRKIFQKATKEEAIVDNGYSVKSAWFLDDKVNLIETDKFTRNIIYIKLHHSSFLGVEDRFEGVE